MVERRPNPAVDGVAQDRADSVTGRGGRDESDLIDLCLPGRPT